MGKDTVETDAHLLSDTYVAPVEVTIDQDPRSQQTPQQQQSQPTTSTTSIPTLDVTPAKQCRICLEVEEPGNEDPDNPLISPCLCSGHSRYVHRNCLQQWRTTTNRQDASYQCEICKFQYQYRRMWYAEILGSIHTGRILFIIIFSLLCYSIGCIVRWESDFEPGECNAFARLALHMVGGLVAIAFVGFFLGMLLLLVRWMILCCGTSDDELPPSHWCLWLLGLTTLCLPEVRLIIITNSPVLIAVQMVWYGIKVACLTLYAGLWLGLVLLLRRAQQMVENVSKAGDEDNTGSQAAAGAAAAIASAVAENDGVGIGGGCDDSKDIEEGGEGVSLLKGTR